MLTAVTTSSGATVSDDLVQRLWNWGAYGRIDPCRPDGSCQNSFWDQMVSGEDDGYGEITATTLIVHQPQPAKAEQDLDEQDAERVDFLVRQLQRDKRVILVRRFQLRHKLGWDIVDPAVRALQDVIDVNRHTVDYIEGRLRGRIKS